MLFFIIIITFRFQSTEQNFILVWKPEEWRNLRGKTEEQKATNSGRNH